MSIFALIHWLGQIYLFMIIGYVLLSWFPNARESYIGQLLAQFVEPYLSIFRRFIPPLGMIDISPIVAIFALQFLVTGIIAVIQFIL